MPMLKKYFETSRSMIRTAHSPTNISQMQRPLRAAEQFELALKSEQNPVWYNNLGIAQQRAGEPAKAEASFRQALAITPGYVECEANLAFLFLAEKHWEEASTDLRTLADQNPKMWNVRMALGFALEKLGRTADALAAYRSLQEDAPPDWPGREQLRQQIENLN